MRLLSVAIEAELGLAGIVKLQIRVPIKRATIVLHGRQRLLRIVGLVELFGSGIARQNVTTVARSGSMRVILVDEVKVNSNNGNVLAIIKRIAFATGAVVGVDIDLPQVLQQVIFLLLAS